MSTDNKGKGFTLGDDSMNSPYVPKQLDLDESGSNISPSPSKSYVKGLVPEDMAKAASPNKKSKASLHNQSSSKGSGNILAPHEEEDEEGDYSEDDYE